MATTIATCAQSASGLASKLKSLQTNQNLVNQAQSSLAKLATRAYNSRQQQAALTCADFIYFTQELVDALKENPASLKIAELAGQIVNGSAGGVACSNEEVASLKSLDGAINETEANIAAEVENVQDSLEGKWMQALTKVYFFNKENILLPINLAQHCTPPPRPLPGAMTKVY